MTSNILDTFANLSGELAVLEGSINMKFVELGLRPVTTRQLMAMRCIEQDPQLVGAIANELRITQQATGKLLRILVKRHLVSITNGKGDGRERCCELTKQGSELLTSLNQ